ncbi:MAG: aldose 1-epimerase family protein [Sphingomonadaceae bacterium]|nr:aldose 1-epimerase family protein [Sphingomonadaceae bacterium]
MAANISIASSALSAEIAPHGAELQSLTDAQGRALMTDADPAYWTGHAPILFPIVGRVNGDRIRIDGREYEMPKHGFARRSHFDLVRSDAASATFRLTDSDATRRHYPFAFALDIDFRIDGATLALTATIRNPDGAPLPASFGFHPAFAWPLPYGGAKEDHVVRFDRDEPGALKAISPDGLIAAATRPSPVEGDTLRLNDALFAHDALVWDHPASDRLRYGVPGKPGLAIAFPDTNRLGVWTKPGAHFLCVEPWGGIADPEGYDGDFRAKPGVFEVASGGEATFHMKVALAA